MDEAWILGGDFNEIMEDVEKLGGPKRKRKAMEDFRKVVDDCDLKDIKPDGNLFTWVSTSGGVKI